MANRIRIVILGGGFAGVHSAYNLQRIWGDDETVEITLISRDNFFLMTPLLFEAGSGILEPRHAVNPIRPMFDTVRFIQAEVLSMDLDARHINVRLEGDQPYTIDYDQLVLAMGGITNTALVPGAENAQTFKTLGDAIFLRNHCIQMFERADAQIESAKMDAALTFIVIGGGFVGMELIGELTEFLPSIARLYPNASSRPVRFELIEAGTKVAKEFDEDLAQYCAKTLADRGVKIRLNTRVAKIEPGKVILKSGEVIFGETIILATGVIPSPLLGTLPLEQKRGAVVVEPTLRVKNRPEIWALGDCAWVPDPQGNPYPPLAQHAIREARLLAENMTAAIRNETLSPFVYQNKGTLAALGHYKGVARVYKFRFKGFIAWWIWRTYYVFQMPRWERRIRVVIDWTVALLFKNDVVQLDLSRGDQASVDNGAGEK